ncbi:hypothetical protein [Ruegeria sp. AD91A]|uniref:hypothetical protein n=1 Tax=Ruegeria sp. AD91A TaxID=2293862 RepID=UPI0013C2FC6B|nr:hypothetical protein [Ruegeria sp. AD91A]
MTMPTEEHFEIERAIEAYFREQCSLQERIAAELVTVSKQQKALLAIFGQASEKLGKSR